MSNTNSPAENLPVVGWREYLSLPELGIGRIKAKIDTGARTSCLHCFSVEPFTKQGRDWVRMGVHPLQDDNETEIWTEAEVLDRRVVTDSGGHREERYVVRSLANLGSEQWPIEMTLTNRDTMKFRMLLGRIALEQRFLVDPSGSFLQSPDL